jgi:hypothetical protein
MLFKHGFWASEVERLFELKNDLNCSVWLGQEVVKLHTYKTRVKMNAKCGNYIN